MDPLQKIDKAELLEVKPGDEVSVSIKFGQKLGLDIKPANGLEEVVIVKVLEACTFKDRVGIGWRIISVNDVPVTSVKDLVVKLGDAPRHRDRVVKFAKPSARIGQAFIPPTRNPDMMDPLPDYDPLDDSFGEDDEKVCVVYWPPKIAHRVKYSLGRRRGTGPLTLLVHSTGERFDLEAEDPGVVDPSGRHQLANFRPPTCRGMMSKNAYKDADTYKRVEIILCFKIATGQAQVQPPPLAPPIISRPAQQQQQQQQSSDEAAASGEIIDGDDRNDDDDRWGGDGESFDGDPPVGVGGVGGGDDGSDEESWGGGDVESFGVNDNYSPGDVDVGGGGSESLLEELQKARQEAQELQQEKIQWEQEKIQWEQEKKSLKKEKREYQIRHMLLETENDLKEQKVAILEESLSTVKALLVDTTTVNRELLLEVKDLKGAQEETEGRLDAVEASADENREDVGNLKNDVEGLATEHQELAGNVAAENQRRELKEYDLDDNMWKLSKEVGDVRTHVDDTADALRQERKEELDEAEENIQKESLAFVNEEFAPEIDDHKENIQRLENDLSNLKDELQEWKDQETGHAATGQATVTRHRRVRLLSIQSRNRNGASRQR